VARSVSMFDYIQTRMTELVSRESIPKEPEEPTEDKARTKPAIERKHYTGAPPSLAAAATKCIDEYNQYARMWKHDQPLAVALSQQWLRTRFNEVALLAASRYVIPPSHYEITSFIFGLLLEGRWDINAFRRFYGPIGKFLIACKSWEPIEGGFDRNFIIVPQMILNDRMLQRCTEAVVRCERILLSVEGYGAPKPVVDMDQVVYGPVLLGYDMLSRAAAFYIPSVDSVFIQSDARNIHELLLQHALLHELGHRYYQKFATAERKAKWKLYDAECRDIVTSSKRMKTGSLIIHPRKFHLRGPDRVLEIKDFGHSVNLASQGSSRVDVTLPKQVVQILTAFPTQYAHTNTEEHFCESFAIYLSDGLIGPSLDAFRSIWTETSE